MGLNVWKEARIPLVVSLVTTVDEQGRPNGSPKTWFTPVSYDPPQLLLSTKPQSDTARNIEATGLFAIHLPGQQLAQKILHTAKPLPHGECEMDDVNLPWEWLEHDRLQRPIPILPDCPWFVCWVFGMFDQMGDHTVWHAQVGLGGGYDRYDGITDVTLHRGRNQFVEVGRVYEVEPY